MLNIIKTALHASSHKVSVVSNNIANAGTTAFKRSEAIFEDFYLQAERQGLALGSGARVQSNRVSHNPAQLKKTGVSSDLAVNGHGMFIWPIQTRRIKCHSPAMVPFNWMKMDS